VTRKHTDYVYRNKDDSIRVRIFQRENGRWDYDAFYPSGSVKTYSDEAGDNFSTKRAALAEANYQHGPLRAITSLGGVTDVAWYRKHQRPDQHHATTKKTPAQLDAEIAEALAAGPPVTIWVHQVDDESDDDRSDDDEYVIGDDGGEFDDSEETTATEVQGDIDERRLHYRAMGRRVTLDVPEGRGWR